MGSDAASANSFEVLRTEINALASEESFTLAAAGLDTSSCGSIVLLSSGAGDSLAVSGSVGSETTLASNSNTYTSHSSLADCTSESEALTISEDTASLALNKITGSGLLVVSGVSIASHALALEILKRSLSAGSDVGRSADTSTLKEELSHRTCDLGALGVLKFVVGGAARSDALAVGEGEQSGA